VEDHVRVSNFAINVLLLQNASITEQNLGIKILESGGLAKPEELTMNETKKRE
jgi:hypothetical protein